MKISEYIKSNPIFFIFGFVPSVFFASVLLCAIFYSEHLHIEGHYKATVLIHYPLEDKKQEIVFRDFMPKVKFKRSCNYVEYIDTLGNYYKISSIAPIEIENIKRIK